MRDTIIANIGLLSFWTGFFSIIDVTVGKKFKNSISEFIFGFHNLDFSTFEFNVINGLLSPFILDEKLSKRRVIMFTIANSILLIIFFWGFFFTSDSYKSNMFDESFGIGLFIVILSIVFVLFSTLCLPFDLFSIFITKRLFWKKKNSVHIIFIKMILDVLLSVFAVVIMWIAVAVFIEAGPFGLIMLLQVQSVVILTLVYFITIFIGIVLRAFIVFTSLNRYTVLYTSLHESPFTFIGIIFGIISIVSTA